METAITCHETVDREELLVHSWRVERLTELGIPGRWPGAYADHVDWHQVAWLVRRGCSPHLALRIVRRRFGVQMPA